MMLCQLTCFQCTCPGMFCMTITIISFLTNIWCANLATSLSRSLRLVQSGFFGSCLSDVLPSFSPFTQSTWWDLASLLLSSRNESPNYKRYLRWLLWPLSGTASLSSKNHHYPLHSHHSNASLSKDSALSSSLSLGLLSPSSTSFSIASWSVT